MVDVLCDVSDVNSISSSTYPSIPVYNYVVPNDRYVVLSQMSFGQDSTFATYGKVKIKINGNVVTNQASAQQEIGLISNLSVDFKERDFIFIEPQSSFEVNARCTSGTGTLQIAISGVILTKDEFMAMRKRIVGV